MMLQPLPKIHNEGQQGWKSPTLPWSEVADEASLTQTKRGKWTETSWGFQGANRAVNHKMSSVPVTSRIPWHHRTAIVLVRMSNDLNRNAIQSAETQNKSTGKQDKAAYLVSPSNPRARTWPEKNQVQHIPKRPIIYCGSKRLCRDDKLTVPFPKDIPQGCTLGTVPAHVACCKFLLESNFCQIQFKKNLICPLPVFTKHSKVSWDFFQMELQIQPGSSLKRPLKSLLLKVPMLWSAAVTSREILWEAPLAVSPALPSSTSCFRGRPEKPGACLSPNSSRSPRTQRGIFCEAFQDPKMIMNVSSGSAKRMLFPAPVSAGSALLTPRASLTCAVLLLCTAAASFDAYLKPGHGGQIEYYFFFPLTHGETLH